MFDLFLKRAQNHDIEKRLIKKNGKTREKNS